MTFQCLTCDSLNLRHGDAELLAAGFGLCKSETQHPMARYVSIIFQRDEREGCGGVYHEADAEIVAARQKYMMSRRILEGNSPVAGVEVPGRHANAESMNW